MFEQVEQVPVLLRKELRQLRRSRGAVISAAALPLILLVVTPLAQLPGIQRGSMGNLDRLPLPGFAGFQAPTDLFIWILFPLFVLVAGLVTPSMAATHMFIAERERRSVELLIALPVSVQDILISKMLALLVLSCLIIAPMFAFDMIMLSTAATLMLTYVLLIALLLFSSLYFSIGTGLLLALVSRDQRTANQLKSALLGPLLPIATVILVGTSGQGRLVLLSSFLLVGATAAVLFSARWLTFERYLN
jgi:ABC-2 type transport system permease protein